MSRLCKLCGQVEDQEHSLLNLRHHQESSNSILQQMKETDRTPYKYFRTYFFLKLVELNWLLPKTLNLSSALDNHASYPGVWVRD